MSEDKLTSVKVCDLCGNFFTREPHVCTKHTHAVPSFGYYEATGDYIEIKVDKAGRVIVSSEEVAHLRSEVERLKRLVPSDNPDRCAEFRIDYWCREYQQAQQMRQEAHSIKAENDRLRVEVERLQNALKLCELSGRQTMREWNERTVELGKAEADRDSWKETARQFYRSADYHRGLVDAIGELFGQEAKTSDDGSIQDDVLCAKVPELCTALKQRCEVAEQLNIKAAQDIALAVEQRQQEIIARIAAEKKAEALETGLKAIRDYRPYNKVGISGARCGFCETLNTWFAGLTEHQDWCPIAVARQALDAVKETGA